MNKSSKNFFTIFIESIGLYFSNFAKFIKYMSFPVCGQIIGLALIFSLTYLFNNNIQILTEKIRALNDIKILLTCLILLILPGIIIYLKAFWEYLISYGALNSMLENMLRSGKVYDFDAHTELIKRRSGKFISLWLLVGVFSLIAAIPLMWVPCGIIAVYCVLIFQVFTFESDLSAIGCAKKSMQLIKGKFAQTFILIGLAVALTYIFIPKIIMYGLSYVKIIGLFTGIINPLFTPEMFEQINRLLIYYHVPPIEISAISKMIIELIVMQILIQYTLPIRSILFSLWYKELNGGINGEDIYTKKTKKTKSPKAKRPSEKLMEKTHKKFAKKKIDRNILKRAMEKDE